MKMTSAEANKQLKNLNMEKEKILSMEMEDCTYNAAVSEDESKLQHEYDFFQTQETIDRIDREMLNLKHKLNVFNSTTQVGETGMTIDQILVRLPQLRKAKEKYFVMMLKPKRKRAGITGNIVDYTYTAYEPNDAAIEYNKVNDEIIRLQLALDKTNMSVEFEV